VGAMTWTAGSGQISVGASIAYGNGIYVGVTNGATVYYSLDGIAWLTTSCPSRTWVSVTFGNGIFVAVCSNSTQQVMTSPDGITWTAKTTPQTNTPWRDVAYGNGLFVATASSGTRRFMFSSDDGESWNLCSTVVNKTFNSIAFGQGVFLAVINAFDTKAYYSEDGDTWTALTASFTSAPLLEVYYANGTFVALKSVGSNLMTLASINDSWAENTTIGSQVWKSIAYGSGRWVIVANTETVIASSPDLIGWVAETSAATSLSTVVYGSDKFVVGATPFYALWPATGGGDGTLGPSILPLGGIVFQDNGTLGCVNEGLGAQRVVRAERFIDTYLK
jgi:hypothetical protein